MNSFSLLSFLLCLGLACAAIIVAGQLHKRYLLLYLSAFNYHVIAAVVYGFFNWLGPLLVYQLLAQHLSRQLFMNILVLLSLMAIPVLIVKVYFLIELATEILERHVSMVFKSGYTIAGLVFFLVYLFSAKYYFDSNTETWMVWVIKLSGILIIAMQYVTLLVVIYLKPAGLDEKKKAAQKIFGVIFLASFSIYILAYFAMFHVRTSWAAMVVPVLYFMVPLPPLLYLKKFLAAYYLEHPLLVIPEESFRQFCQSHLLSDREQEIIGLLLQGQSKIEMADRLFLSPHTVRNHLANIYKKLGVNNKVQLSYLVQNFSAKG